MTKNTCKCTIRVEKMGLICYQISYLSGDKEEGGVGARRVGAAGAKGVGVGVEDVSFVVGGARAEGVRVDLQKSKSEV